MKNLITQKTILGLFEDFTHKNKTSKDAYFVFINYLQRNIKKENNYFDLDTIIQKIYYNLKKHKTGDTFINKIFVHFMKKIKESDLKISKKSKHFLMIPKPKIFRDIYRSWYLLHTEILYLKSLNKVEKGLNSLSKLKIDKRLSIIKKHKKLLGQYISIKETKSKIEITEEMIQTVEYYKFHKDFKPKTKGDFLKKVKESY
jgi:hypothetical protein